ncbi:MAG TPA: adenylosuccinate synthetase [Jatrophihabitans sp.]|nr:adenylosuccinate synthetase [Jatrophihabitans sp.]
MPMTQAEFARAVPIYETFPGWDEDISDARALADLPANCRAYVEAIESMIGARISVIGVGPDRNASIVLHDLLG